MRLPLAISFADGRQSYVTAGPADFVAFERHYKCSSNILMFKTKVLEGDDGTPLLDDDGDPQVVLDFADWEERIHVEWLFFLSWNVLRRTQQEGGGMKFDAFLETVEDISFGRAPAEKPESGVDPTSTSTQQPDESLGSPSAPDSTPTPSPPTPISSKRSSTSSPSETANDETSASSSS